MDLGLLRELRQVPPQQRRIIRNWGLKVTYYHLQLECFPIPHYSTIFQFRGSLLVIFYLTVLFTNNINFSEIYEVS